MAEQLQLTLRTWRKIRLSSFGRRNVILFAIPEKKSLAQAGSRRNHPSRRMMSRDSWVQRYEVIRGQPLQTQGGGYEVVQQLDVFQIQLSCQRRGVQHPRQVFRVVPPLHDRARYPKPSGINCQPARFLICCCRLFEKILDQIFETRVVPGRETTLEHRTKGKPVLPEQPKIAFCAANVPSQNHRRLAP